MSVKWYLCLLYIYLTVKLKVGHISPFLVWDLKKKKKLHTLCPFFYFLFLLRGIFIDL